VKHEKIAHDEGSIKFHCDWHYAEPFDSPLVRELLAARDQLFDLGLIGALPDGIGYGNASVGLDRGHFLVTGSGSGGVKRLDVSMLTVVSTVDFEKNCVVCHGPVIASSESMTHAALYQADPMIGSALHIHSRALWEKLFDRAPTTRSDVPYGTPAMAAEIARLFKEEHAGSTGVIVMGGHQDGLLCFGRTIAEAGSAVAGALATTTF
jgi:L-ribulose-5-phosphate 4-epimerase